ncbi:AAA family ATPase [Streptacidiphilus sp. N1-3]|uniref:AAA family ATPase n=1 Tax=Streptacidiphilus alkalitolerans TaxID=3342712 RepID=A0ABV6WUD8_9ACTN
MSSIVSFEIAGLAGREEIVRHELHSDVNVFWGPNGGGKTSTLKILHSALQNDASILVRVPFDSAVVRIRSGSKIIERRIKNLSSKNMQERAIDATLFDDYEWRDRQAGQRLIDVAEKMRWTSKPASTTAFNHSYLSILRLSDSPRTRPGVPSSDILDEVAYDRMFARQIQNIWRDYYMRELMQVRTAQQNALVAIATSVMSRSTVSRKKKATASDIGAESGYIAVKSFFESQNLDPHFGGYEKFSTNYQTNDLMREVVAEIVEVQNGLEAAQEPKRAIEELIDELFRGRMRVDLGGRYLRITQGQRDIPLESLSSGQKQVVRILVECLTAGSNSVIIDEPEISMHVDWQHRLVSCMQTVNPNAQLILATHSPEIMATLLDRNIIEL